MYHHHEPYSSFILHVSQNVSHSEEPLILVTVYDITSFTNGYKRSKHHATKANSFEEVLSFNKVSYCVAFLFAFIYRDQLLRKLLCI